MYHGFIMIQKYNADIKKIDVVGIAPIRDGSLNT